jgi:hypothetical protein
MNSSSSNLVPLQLASLCLDCEMISSAGGRCVACGSSALLNVGRMLSRPGSAHFSTDKYAASPVSFDSFIAATPCKVHESPRRRANTAPRERRNHAFP